MNNGRQVNLEYESMIDEFSSSEGAFSENKMIEGSDCSSLKMMGLVLREPMSLGEGEYTTMHGIE